MTVLRARLLALGLTTAISGTAFAQSTSAPPPAPATSAPAAAATPAQELLKPEEIDQLVAQIALYPDTLLAEVLMASTYPLEVVQASRWVDENKALKGEQLKAAADKQSWDDSVKALTATPTVLSMMSAKLSWTQKLGDAVLAQQPDVMDAVQRLRGKAQAQNKLQSTKEQKVTVSTQQNKQVIVIEPTQPDVIYVPQYDPAAVYGAWPYPAYPPYYYPPAGGYLAAGAIGFGVGFALGAWAGNNNNWGGSVNWTNNNINIDRNTNVGSGNKWTHKPEHRQGVRYNNKDVAKQFGRGDNARGNAQDRMDFRGREGQQVLRPDNDRPGDRPGGAGDRAGDRGSRDRPATADRGGKGGGGNRPANADRGSSNRPATADRGGGGRDRPDGGSRGGGRDSAFSGAGGSGRAAMAQSNRGHSSLGGGGGGGARCPQVEAVGRAWVAAEVAAGAAEVAVAAGAPTSISSTISPGWAASTMELVSIASATTAAPSPMSA